MFHVERFRCHEAKIEGQVENAEVLKPKYGSEKKSRLSVSSALLCVLRPCSQRVTLSLRCESQILGSRTAASVAITMPVSVVRPKPRLTMSGPTMRGLCS